MHELPAAGPSLLGVAVTPLAKPGAPEPSGQVNVTVSLRDAPAAERGDASTVTLGFAWDCAGGPACDPAWTGTYPIRDGAVTLLATVPKPRVWEAAATTSAAPSAQLHNLSVTLMPPKGRRRAEAGAGGTSGGALAVSSDTMVVRFGLRVVSTAGRAILLNGRPVKLKGFNRHDLYPGLGPALPVSQYAADLDLLQRSLRGNFVRGAHYPQDGRFLDLCDERGVLVWNEALAWGNWAPTLTDPTFMAAELGTAAAMLASSANHPSIILWGFFNEGQSDSAEAVPSYASMAAAFRADRSRLVTWASNRKSRDLALEHADVVSFNSYPGWYGGGAETVVASWEADAEWVASHWPDKPFIISETGAGGIYRNRSSNLTSPSRWSEDYQASGHRRRSPAPVSASAWRPGLRAARASLPLAGDRRRPRRAGGDKRLARRGGGSLAVYRHQGRPAERVDGPAGGDQQQGRARPLAEAQACCQPRGRHLRCRLTLSRRAMRRADRRVAAWSSLRLKPLKASRLPRTRDIQLYSTIFDNSLAHTQGPRRRRPARSVHAV